MRWDLQQHRHVWGRSFQGIGSVLRMVLLSLLGISLVIGCQPQSLPPATPPISSRSTTTQISPSPSAACVSRYDAAVDYFPDKVQFQYAQGIRVEYHRHYKIVTLPSSTQPAYPAITYILVQCGTPAPSGVQGTVVTVPIATIAALSSTYLPHLDSLGVLDRLVAIDHRKHINNRTVQTYVQQGKVREVGTESSLNTEQLLDVNPALVMTYQIPGATADNVTRLTAAGLTVVVNAEYLETSPLGRAEWLKFMALFFNREREANQHFADVVQRYQKVAAIAAAATDRPTILAGLEIGGTWYMPGGRSYVATYFRDAGGSYLWAADSTTGSIPLSFETVLDRAALANVWLTSSLDWKTHADILATDRRYLNFAAVRTKRVFNNNARVNASGGNDYWEQGVLQPDVVLADLVKILHPTLLPSHQLVYYRQLN